VTDSWREGSRARSAELGSRIVQPRRGRLAGAGLMFAFLALAFFLATLVGPSGAGGAPLAVLAGPCEAPVNVIACENSKPGTPGEWRTLRDPSIVGFATEMSAIPGETMRFKVNTDASAYVIHIYRLGYYNGDGARKLTTITPSAALPQTQPACLQQPATGLVDCGNWALSASWQVPSDAVSGVYLARLDRADTGVDNEILFVVRDDTRHSDILFQTSDATWQAYNDYGGNSLYVGDPAFRAYKVSYNRPLNVADPSYLFNGEYPTLRWLEANGYDVSYTTGVDSARRGAEMLEHDVFLSVGHDEYWSGEQRTNVQAARDAGVNLAFLSGNESFWKTRWESSIESTPRAYRTLVSYKETHAGAKIDPSPLWTGSWRDPRFSPPSDGGRPENALTGTSFSVNEPRNDHMYVPSQYGKLRFWRNTSVASLQSGDRAELPTGVLGYEWDADVDNGFRPPGLMNLSSSTFTVSTLLLDYGSTYGAGTATHHLTLYRAPSGALVFGAGTVQWGWGLDNDHWAPAEDGVIPGPTADQRMRQATMNLLADMRAQPTTIRPGLIAATKTTDTTKPTSSILEPDAGDSFTSGQVVTVFGTASDSGGVVAGVEVSTDGGATWHPASGTTFWTYSWKVGGYGSIRLKTRAVDDSGNVEVPGTGISVTVSCPCRLWPSTTVPVTASAADTSAVELGVKFRADLSGTVTGVRFYKGPLNTGTHIGSLWDEDGTLLARATFTGETATGWQNVNFATPVEISSNTIYIASYFAPVGGYSLNRPFFDTTLDSPPLHAPSNTPASGNGVFAAGATPTFPSSNFASSNYWVDLTFVPAPPDSTPPTVSSVIPAAGATGFSTVGDLTVDFSEAINSNSLTGSTLTLRTLAGTVVPATVAYDAASQSATLDPSGPLSPLTKYTATVDGGSDGVTDRAGNPLAANFVWSFTTASGPVCPCTLWSAAATPATSSAGDTSALELGVKFTADRDGWVSGIRFYKDLANTGTHTGSLWTSTGTLLARATFTGETASGWQQVNFAAPVAISADTTYVVSYYAPKGGYSISRPFFTAAFDNGFLHALADGSSSGTNGVYALGAAPTFPASSFQASNYWVDLVYLAAPPDVTPPTVSSTTPSSGATGFSTAGEISATFSESINPATVTASTFLVRNSSGASIAGAVSYDAVGRSATFTPTAPLTRTTVFTATIKGGTSGVTDRAGNKLAADYNWSFTTATGPACPCTLWSASKAPQVLSIGEPAAVELGVKFRADTAGTITGVRFYKGPGNTGTHVGSLWSSTGTLLSRATFTGETAGGWQQVNFASPVAITADTTYVASYYAPNGNFPVDRNYFSVDYDNTLLHAPTGGNGVYGYSATPAYPSSSFQSSNYWVDVVFMAAPPDVTAPTVVSKSPAAGATGVGTTAVASAVFGEALEPATVTPSTAYLRGPGGAAVAASVSYDAASRTVAIAADAPLAAGTAYTATLKGGATGIKDPADNPLASDVSWTFTTGSGPVCPCTIWSVVRTPQDASTGETAAVEVGVKFSSDLDGRVTGVRFYKGPGNTGTHVGSLWTAGGILLGRATFSGESASGWQQVNFASPIAISKNTTYVVSYFAPNGNFAIDRFYFANPYGIAMLHALANSAGGNGVYAYGAAPTFPVSSFQSSNYWVDVAFVTP
jgi:hypothetical protein